MNRFGIKIRSTAQGANNFHNRIKTKFLDMVYCDQFPSGSGSSSRKQFATALETAIKARGLCPKTISPDEKRKIADVVRSTLDVTGQLRKY